MRAAAAATAAAAAAAPAPQLPADDARIAYTGRFAVGAGGARLVSWPASQAACAFDGTSVSANISAPAGDRWLAVVDGAPAGYVTAKGAAAAYPVASGLAQGRHTLSLWKVSEAPSGRGASGAPTAFHGFALPDGGKFLPAPARPARRLEFIGDSDTAGYCADGKPTTIPLDTIKWEDASKTWAAQLSHALGAEYHAQAVSGIGVLTKVSKKTIGDLVDNIIAFDKGAGVWNYTQWTPDAVFILVGPNDCTGSCPKGFNAAYRALMDNVVGNYAHAAAAPKIISVCGGSINGLDPCPSIQEVHKDFNAGRTDGFAASYVSIDPATWKTMQGFSQYNGCVGHYNEKGHAILEGQILPGVKQILGW